MLDHLFRDFEIGDDAVAQRADGGDVAGRAAQHHLRLVADGEHLLLALDLGDGDDRRLVQDDAAALDVDQRVRRAEIDRHVGGEHAQQIAEHRVPSQSHAGRADVRLSRHSCVPTVGRPFLESRAAITADHAQADSAAGAVFCRFTSSLLSAWI